MALNINQVITIGTLFNPLEIFIDSDQDGYPDRLDICLSIDETLDHVDVWAGILNLVARLSFETVTFDPGLIQPTCCQQNNKKRIVIYAPGQKPDDYPEEINGGFLWRSGPKEVSIGGSCAKTISRIINTLATGDYSNNQDGISQWDRITLTSGNDEIVKVFCSQQQQIFSLIPDGNISETSDVIDDKRIKNPIFDFLDLNGDNGWYGFSSDNPRSRILSAGILISQSSVSRDLGLALACLVSEMVLEATELSLPMVVTEDILNKKVILQIEKNSEMGDAIFISDSKDKNIRIIASGNEDFLCEALKKWMKLACFKDGPLSEKADAVRSEIDVCMDLIKGEGYWGRWMHFLVRESLSDDMEEITAPKDRQKKLKDAFTALDIQKTLCDSDVNCLTLNKNWSAENHFILEQIKKVSAGQGQLNGIILVSKPDSIRQDLKKQLENRLSELGYIPHLQVMNSYKAGLCWLMEQVLPDLKNIPSITNVEIGYQPFPTDDKTLEVRSRWLQEMYPGPDLLMLELNLTSDDVVFHETGEFSDIYHITAKTADGTIKYNQGFSPRYRCINYLNMEPELGYSHPSTSCIKLFNDDVILDLDILTDRDRFWTEFQTRWLPELAEQMRKRLETESFHGQPAFWEEIRIEVYFDETDIRLSLDGERICPMEALHEDIYFAMLDFYAGFARRNKLPPEIQLGQVIPKVYSKTKNDKPFISLKAKPLQWAQAPDKIKRLSKLQTAINALGKKDGSWFIDIVCSNLGFNSSERQRFSKVLKAWGIEAEWINENLRIYQKRPTLVKVEQPKKAIDLPLPDHRMLTVSEVNTWVENLALFPNLKTWTAACSWQKRKIGVIEAVLENHNRRNSLAKMRLLKPTILFNARHHANEISSTNATLKLAVYLSSDPEGKELLKHVNVVMIPMENPDGSALLEELLPECPDHKLHAARYNAFGSEYYADYFAEKPRFSESLAKTRLWKRWLPELVIDQHGVPSHEWDQPYSGNAPYRFRDFWIPMTFAFAYVPFIDDPNHPNHEKSKAIKEHLVEAMSKDQDILDLNKKMAERYRRYAHFPAPNDFPPSSGAPLMILPLLARTHKTNSAVRYPDITHSELVIELPDEVVSGRSLKRCIKANRIIQNTLIQFIQCDKPLKIKINTSPKIASCYLQW